jgi:arabinofuranosyltransferase
MPGHTPLPKAIWSRLIVLAVALVVLVRTAWICDDAFITYRTVDNFVNGLGLRWNVAERVQTFTHPLWMLTYAAFYAVTREPYYTGIALGIATTLVALGLYAWRSRDPWLLIAGAVVLLCSKTFVDFSTSGLENPLSHVLLLAFLIAWAAPGSLRRRQLALFTCAGLALSNRHDLAALLAIPVAFELWRTRSAATMWRLVIGLAPFLAWEAMSLLYYGFPLPNTAYAKLNTGIARADLVAQGFSYYLDSWQRDPVTLAAICAGTIACLVRWADWGPIGLGLMTYGAYVVVIGGDNMSGRFLTAPLVVVVGVLGFGSWRRPEPIAGVVALAVAVLVATGPRPLPFATGAEYGVGEPIELKADATTGIDDERRYYYPETGLLRQLKRSGPPDHPWVHEGASLRARGSHVAVSGFVGFVGFYAGPAVHILDCHALGDALMARLPADRYWRTGHYARRIPAGYATALHQDSSAVVDPEVRAYYSKLETIVRGPLLSAERWRYIAQLNLGLSAEPSAGYQAEPSACDAIIHFYRTLLWANRPS